MDLISCRNLLIYLGPDLQKRIFPLFHYALNPNGFLVLGQSETIAAYPDLFAVVNKSTRIYSKNTSLFLSHLPGASNLNLLKMAREGLAGELHSTIERVKKEGTAFKKEGLRIKQNGSFKQVSVEVIPLKTSSMSEPYFLILFGESSSSASHPVQGQSFPRGGMDVSKKSGLEEELTLTREELASTKIYMQSVIEEREAANEQLQSANEEILSSNEELQSLNEELYSANEEL